MMVKAFLVGLLGAVCVVVGLVLAAVLGSTAPLLFVGWGVLLDAGAIAWLLSRCE